MFLREGVPEHLKRQALRKLWRSDPLLANLDGLNDYDEDFAALYAAASKAVKTAYRVGRGWLGSDDETDETAASASPAEERSQGVATASADEEGDGRDEGSDESPRKA